jgi:tetratricopeptide (TPR) repeat protein
MAGSVGGFTTREAARITGLSVARVRRLAREDGLALARESQYSFGDLLLLRQVKRLLDAGVGFRRIRHTYDLLSKRGYALTRLLLSAERGTIVAANAGRRWDPSSGQLILPYGASRAASRAVLPLRRRKPASRTLSSDQWYELGVDLEASSITGAIDAYRQAVSQDPKFVEAHINLGRLLHVSGALREARKHYERALRLDPLDPIPAFNLGVVLEDIGAGDEALRHYRLALRRDPDFADAHYNIALVYERRGCPLQALKHARRYHELTGSAPRETR